MGQNYEKKDTYLEALYEQVNLCNLVLQNKSKFSTEQIKEAEKVKRNTEGVILQYISLR